MLKKSFSLIAFCLGIATFIKADPIQVAGTHVNTFWDQQPAQ
jgi:hypothetical protein